MAQNCECGNPISESDEEFCEACTEFYNIEANDVPFYIEDMDDTHWDKDDSLSDLNNE